MSIEIFWWFRATPDETLPSTPARQMLRFTEIREQDLRGPLVEEKGRAERFKARLKDGHQCYGHLDDQCHLVSYIWVSMPRRLSRPVPFGGPFHLAIQGGDSYVWDCRTAEPVQGHGLYTESLRQVRRMAATEECRKIWINSEKANPASQKAILNAGFVQVGSCRVISFSKLSVIITAQGNLRLPTRPIELRDLVGNDSLRTKEIFRET